MPISYTYYRQGNGVDSWIAVETDGNGEVTSKYMVYEDPNKKETIRSFEKLTTEEIASFKSIIGITGDGGGGSTAIVSGEGIAAIQNMDGSYTINNSAPFPGLSEVMVLQLAKTRMEDCLSKTQRHQGVSQVTCQFLMVSTLTFTFLKTVY